MIPIILSGIGSHISTNNIETYATSGIVITPYFGDKFDINAFELQTGSVLKIKNPYFDAFEDDGCYGNLTLKFKYDIEDEMEWIKVNGHGFLNPKEHEHEMTIPNFDDFVNIVFNRQFEFWTDLKTKRFTGFQLEWVYDNKGLNETELRHYRTPSLGNKNLYVLYIVLANLVHSLDQSLYDELWRVVKQVKADWVDVITKPESNGYGGYWGNNGDPAEMFQDIFKEIKEKGNFNKKLIPRTPIYEKEITDFTLETAAEMFLYIMTEQKDKDWVDWKDEYSEWLTTSSLRRLQGNIADFYQVYPSYCQKSHNLCVAVAVASVQETNNYGLKNVEEIKEFIFNELSRTFNLTSQHFKRFTSSDSSLFIERGNIIEYQTSFMDYFYLDYHRSIHSEKIHKILNHPVHIIDEIGQLSPSAFIPFCDFGGNIEAVSESIKEFDVPVCNSFTSKILNDQHCYEMNLNDLKTSFSTKDFEYGVTFLIDTNDDRQFPNSQTKKKDEFMIYLDTLCK